MESFDQFKRELQAALLHLHDADYQFPEHVCHVLECNDAGEAPSTLRQWIKGLAPPRDVSEETRSHELYLVLHHRYLLGMTQEEAAHTLYMSPRTLQRHQRNAVHVLARRIWDAYEVSRVASPHAAGYPTDTPATWETQVQQELSALKQSALESSCDLQSALHGAMHIATQTMRRAGVSLVTEGVPESCHVALRLSIAEQVILMVLTGLGQAVDAGEIVLTVTVKSEHADIVFTAAPVAAPAGIDLAFARELIGTHGGELTTHAGAQEFAVTLRLPRVRQAGNRRTVLVVDDNATLATLYASYCVDTDYDVIHVGRGRRVVEVAEELRPDVILLDVLLPDVNGWHLLIDLQTASATRGIPVIICSVITDAQMALDLGAVLYLQKPVWRQPFLDALDQVLTSDPTAP